MNRISGWRLPAKGKASGACTETSQCGSPIRHNHLTPGGAKRQCGIRREHMTISAQVIDTIVEWIDDNLHQPCVLLMISLAMPGIRNGICNGCFTVQGESWGYIREAAAGRPRSARHRSAGLRYLPQVYEALIRNRPLPRLYPDLQSAAGRLPQRTHGRPLRRALLV